MRSSFFFVGLARVAIVILPCLACGNSTDSKRTDTDGGTSEGGAAPAPTPTPTGWRAAVGAGGVLVQTFDEQRWETRTIAMHDLFAVACVGNLLGWAAGPLGAVAHTDDGGRTWTEEDSHLRVTLRAIRFADASFGVVVGDGGSLATTRDGGATWASVSSGVTSALRGVAVADGGRAIVVGAGGVVLRTADGGRTFARAAIDGAPDLEAVALDAAAHMAVTVDAAGGIWASVDGGGSFRREHVAPRGLHAVSLHPRGLYAIAAGDDGTALERGADGTWTPLATGTHATLRTALVSENGAADYVAGDRGTLLARPAGPARPARPERPQTGAFQAIPSGTEANLYALEDL